MPKFKLFPALLLALSYPAFGLETSNLLTNPGAETGDLTGWTAVCYSYQCTPPVVDSGNDPHSGRYDFVSNANDSDGTLTQTVTLVGVQGITADEINSGQLYVHVSFWEHGNDNDAGAIQLTFLSASNTVVDTVLTSLAGSADPAPFDVAGSWQFGAPCARCNSSFQIPPGTASISYTMYFFINLAGATDVYDNGPVIDDNFMSVSSSMSAASGADSVATGLQKGYLGTALASSTYWDPTTGVWYSQSLSAVNFSTESQWGIPSDLSVIGDFDGDGLSDVAVYRPSVGNWIILQSYNGETITQQWGEPSDIPVAGDFDGDGKTDFAVFRPATGYWYIIQSSTGQTVAQQWGAPSDVPVVGDFDGDGKSDIAVFRPSTGYWYIIQSSSGEVVERQWGESTDIPVAGDFDGDGKSDIAVYRPSNGEWYVVQSSDGAVVTTQFGIAGDIPVAGDYDGDGKTDIAVYRPTAGGISSYILQSTNGKLGCVQTPFDVSSSIPVSSLSR